MLTIKANQETGECTIRIVSDENKRLIARLTAADMDEVHNAVSHYFCEPDHQDCTAEYCPICRWESCD